MLSSFMILEKLKIFFKRKSYIIIPFLLLFVILCISVLLSKSYYIFGFSTLGCIFVLSGLGLAKFFENQLSFKDIIGYLTNSLIFGIFINIIGLQVLGLLNIEYSNTFLNYFWLLIILFNVSYFLLTEDRKEKYQFPKISKRNYIDLLWFGLFVLFFFFIVQICIEQFFPNWDSFTFWGVDAKYLYESRGLRDSSFLRLNGLPYSSVYTSLFFLTYVLFGGIYEQFASLITVLFSFLSFMLLFNRFRYQNNALTKNLSYLGIVFILTTFLTLQSILVSLYSDVFCAFLVLLFTIVLTNKSVKAKDYYKRALTLITISLFFYLVKAPYITITLVLLMIWSISDIFYFRHYFKRIVKDWKFIFMLLVEAVFFYSMISYLNSLIVVSYTTYLNDEFAPIREYVAYVFTLLFHVAENIPLIMLLYGVFIFYFLIFLFSNRKILLSSAVFVSVTLIPMGIFLYLLSNDFMSKSLIRYISLGFFLLPYIFMSIPQQSFKKIQILFSTVATISIGILCIYYIFIAYSLNFKIDLSSGSYIDAMPQHYNLAQKVKSIIGVEKVTIVDEVDSGYVGDAGLPSIYVKYYFLYNNSESSYKVPVEDFYQFYEEFDSDYLLILEYDGYWNECNNIFEINRSYLVRKDKIDFEGQLYCPFENSFTAL